MDSSSAQDHVDPGVDESAAEILRLWKNKQPADPVVAPERGPLTLLKLPVDILRLILNEVCCISYPRSGPSKTKFTRIPYLLTQL